MAGFREIRTYNTRYFTRAAIVASLHMDGAGQGQAFRKTCTNISKYFWIKINHKIYILLDVDVVLHGCVKKYYVWL